MYETSNVKAEEGANIGLNFDKAENLLLYVTFVLVSMLYEFNVSIRSFLRNFCIPCILKTWQ